MVLSISRNENCTRAIRNQLLTLSLGAWRGLDHGRRSLLRRKILIGKENSLRSHALTHAARTGIQTHGTGVRSVDHAQQRHRTTHHCPLTRGAPTGAPCATPRRPQSRPQLTSARRFCATQRSSVASARVGRIARLELRPRFRLPKNHPMFATKLSLPMRSAS